MLVENVNVDMEKIQNIEPKQITMEIGCTFHCKSCYDNDEKVDLQFFGVVILGCNLETSRLSFRFVNLYVNL